MQRFFITAPGTGIGKTLVTAALSWQLRKAGKKVTALKPVISGYNPHSENDTSLILKSCGIMPTPKTVEAISPWRFTAPLSPNMAADKEGKPQVDFEQLITFCQDTLRSTSHVPHSTLIIEGIGGVMTPINNHHTVLDWMAALGWPVIMVTGSYLGSISHTLMALEVLRTKGLPLKALVISESEFLNSSPRRGEGISLQEVADTLEKFLLSQVPVVKIPRLAATAELWQSVPPLSGICP